MWFEIATVGFQGTSVNIGQLSVSYHVVHMMPQYNNGLMGGFVLSQVTQIYATVAAASPFGTGTITPTHVISTGGPGDLYTVTGGNVITLANWVKGGVWRVELRYQGTGAVVAASSVTLGAGLVRADNNGTGSQSMVSFPEAGVTAGLQQYVILVRVVDPEGVKTITRDAGFGGIPTSLTSAYITVSQYYDQSSNLVVV